MGADSETTEALFSRYSRWQDTFKTGKQIRIQIQDPIGYCRGIVHGCAEVPTFHPAVRTTQNPTFRQSAHTYSVSQRVDIPDVKDALKLEVTHKYHY